MIGNIYINGCIGVWEGEPSVTLIDIVKQVKEQPNATAYNVYINSEGGYVDVGFDILNYLRSLGKPLTTIGSGIVASIATVIFMAGSTRQIRENTQFMIHLPWMSAEGTASDLEISAKELKQTEKQLLDFYKKELNLSEEVLQPLLRDESWLTNDQLHTLGFTTSQPLQIAAKARIKLKSENTMTEEDKGFIAGLFKGFEKLFKNRAKNKLVQDATGTELDFTDLADDAPIETGAAATVDGSPAEGEFTLPDGTVYVFAAGLLTEIKEPATDELAAATEKIAELESQLAAKDNEHTAQLNSIKKEFDKVKAQVTSKFDVDRKKNPDKRKTNDADDPDNRFAGASERVRNLKKK